MTGTLLRLPHGMQLSDEFSQNLEKLTGPVEITHYGTGPEFNISYDRRRDSLFDAFLFILKALPPTNSRFSEPVSILKKYAESAKASCVFNKQAPIDQLQNTLKTFKTELIHAMTTCWAEFSGSHSQELATECLNEAEQYVLLQKTRKNIATVLPKKIQGKQCYILQCEQVLPPGQESWYNELRSIQALETPGSPDWFYKLSPVEQEYIANFQGTHLKTELKDFLDFCIILENSRASKLYDDFAAIMSNTNPPEWFTKLSSSKQTFFRANLPNPIDNIQNIIRRFYENCAEDIQALNKLPLWYTSLSTIQQHFLGYVLKEAGDKPLETVFTWLSSRHRTLPALANARRHHLMVLDEQGEILFRPQERFGSSHIVSRDVRNMGEAIVKKHMQNNLQQICDLISNEAPVIVQTLISPVPATQYLPQRVSSRLPPDLDLFTQLKKIVNEFNHKTNEIIQPNHPLNLIKYVNYTSDTDRDCNALLKIARSEEKQKNMKLKALAAAYDETLNSSFGSATFLDYRGRELFLSSLEQLLIMELGGLSYGSCVSGKDRKAIEFIHTDAMLLYAFFYKKLHTFYDSVEDRKNFIDIVVDLYVSRHQQEHAGQNAPGSEAIKTPDMYWPGDISRAIKSRLKDESALKHEDRVASNNEVNKIGTDNTLDPRLAGCKLTAIALGEEKCQKIYDMLCPIMEERDRFKKSGWTPNLYSSAESLGIQKIRELIEQKPKDQINICDIVAKILNIIISRPEGNEGRTQYTNTVYRLGHSIHKAPHKIDDILLWMSDFYSKTLQENRGRSCVVY